MGMGIGQILYMVAAILIAFFYWLIGPSRQSVKKRSVVRPNITSRRSVRRDETLHDIFGMRRPEEYPPD